MPGTARPAPPRRSDPTPTPPGLGQAARLAGLAAVAGLLLLGALATFSVHHYRAAQAGAPGTGELLWTLGAAGGAALLLLGFTWLSIRRLIRPLAEMSRRVEALASGSAAPGPLATGRRDEVGRLSAAVDHLLAELDRSQRELRASEERFRLAFKTSPEPLSLTRMSDGTVVACNDGFLSLHGLTEEQVIGRRTVDLGLWIDPAERAAIAAEIASGRPVRARDVRVRAAGGATRVVDFSASRVVMGGEAYLLALGRDVTEERQAAAERERLAAALRESEERYRSVMRSVPVVQWAIGLDDRFTLSEGRGLAALGLAPGEVVGRSVLDVYRDHPDVLEQYRRARNGESFVALNDFGPVVFESHWGSLRDAAGNVVGVTGIALDVTARRRAEGHLIQAQKMDAVGRLASGIAHDFNNLLVVIVGGCEHLLAQRDCDPQVQALAGEMLEAGQRAAALVRQLLAFGRKTRLQPERCTLNGVVGGFEKLLRRTLGENVTVEVTLCADPWTVSLDPQQLEQVLLNLSVNARDAMAGGGLLRITTDNVEVGAAGGVSRWARLSVSDNGTGMAPDVREHIFEPFFTTKGRRGTGLGLATVFALVDQAGGRIEVDTAPGLGSTFTVLFPAVAEAAPHPPRPPSEPAARGGGERILVVEDDPAVRRSTARMLRELGFAAVEAEDQEAALRHVEGGEVDALLTDVVMPGMSGPELAARLRELRPGLPVVFATGYMDQHQHRLPQGALTLEKPFTLERLGRRLVEALSGRRAATPGERR